MVAITFNCLCFPREPLTLLVRAAVQQEPTTVSAAEQGDSARADNAPSTTTICSMDLTTTPTTHPLTLIKLRPSNRLLTRSANLRCKPTRTLRNSGERPAVW